MAAKGDRLAEREGPVRVAVDAMGGDYAPVEVVAGAVEAARSDGVQIGVVGDPEQVQAELSKHDTAGLPIMVVPSEGVVLEGEAPARALRQKPKASIVVSTGLVKKGLADASVTMGSTGAAMAAAAVVLGVTDGVERPALGGPVVGLAPRTVILDVGTNVDCRPAQLVSFAAIGHVFARQFWGIESPRVALLSVGAEAGKGNRQVQETSGLMAKTGLNFIGNVEPNDLTAGAVDVAVCDGFVGNVVMKLTEGLGAGMADLISKRLNGKLPEDELNQLVAEVYEASHVVETFGGGPLFGVNGVSVVGHGRGKAESVRRAIGTAKRTVEVDFVAHMNRELAQVRESLGD